MHKAIVFHVPNDRFDGIASFELTPDAASRVSDGFGLLINAVGSAKNSFADSTLWNLVQGTRVCVPLG